jgi:hypothetical protein
MGHLIIFCFIPLLTYAIYDVTRDSMVIMHRRCINDNLSRQNKDQSVDANKTLLQDMKIKNVLTHTIYSSQSSCFTATLHLAEQYLANMRTYLRCLVKIIIVSILTRNRSPRYYELDNLVLNVHVSAAYFNFYLYVFFLNVQMYIANHNTLFRKYVNF